MDRKVEKQTEQKNLIRKYSREEEYYTKANIKIRQRGDDFRQQRI